MARIGQLTDFLDKGIWEIRLKDLSTFHAILVRYVRTIVLASRNFARNDSIRTASVLTYYSVLNFVPLIAVVFAIAKGFGLRKMIQNYVVQLADTAHLQPDVANQIIIFSNSLLKQARGGVIAGIGIVLLLWTVISILGKIEDSFNSIWEVKRPRTLLRKSSDYMSILVVVPILFAVSASATVLVTSQLKMIMKEVPFLDSLGSGAVVLVGFLPYISIWMLLVVVYIVMPNTRVRLRSGLLAGVTAGTGFQIIQFAYLKLQIGISSYGAIYGSFAAIPLFLAWLQVSWVIVLYGAEIAHAAEHSDTFGFYPDYSRIGGAARRFFMLRVFHLIVKRFQRGESPLNARQMANRLQIPVKLVEDSIDILRGVGLIIEVAGEGLNNAFQPAKAVEDMTVQDVLDAYDRSGDELPRARSKDEEKEFDDTIRQICSTMDGRENLKIREL